MGEDGGLRVEIRGFDEYSSTRGVPQSAAIVKQTMGNAGPRSPTSAHVDLLKMSPMKKRNDEAKEHDAVSSRSSRSRKSTGSNGLLKGQVEKRGG